MTSTFSLLKPWAFTLSQLGRTARRYARLWWVFIKNSLTLEMEYRTATISEFFIALTSAAWQLTSIWVFFVHTDSLGDWQFWEATVVLGLFIFFDGFIEMFFRPNMEQIIEHIRMGTLDFVLLKPVNSQFLATTRLVRFRHLGSLLTGLGLIAYSLTRIAIEPQFFVLLFFLILLLSGALILYSILLVLVTLAFWFVNVTNIIELIWSVYEAGRVPVDIFPGVVRIFLTFVVPIAFITTVPAEALLGRVDPLFASLSLLMSVAALGGSSAFWHYAVRHYSSASS